MLQKAADELLQESGKITEILIKKRSQEEHEQTDKDQEKSDKNPNEPIDI